MQKLAWNLLISWIIPHLLCLRNAHAFPLLPAALASVPFGFVLVRVRVWRVLTQDSTSVLATHDPPSGTRAWRTNAVHFVTAEDMGTRQEKLQRNSKDNGAQDATKIIVLTVPVALSIWGLVKGVITWREKWDFRDQGRFRPGRWK